MPTTWHNRSFNSIEKYHPATYQPGKLSFKDKNIELKNKNLITKALK